MECLRNSERNSLVVGIDGSTYDASKHPTLLKNQQKMTLNKVVDVLFTYLSGIEVLFDRSEILINPERRIEGVKIDEKMIRTVHFP